MWINYYNVANLFGNKRKKLDLGFKNPWNEQSVKYLLSHPFKRADFSRTFLYTMFSSFKLSL